jgi:hypothetical protein
MAAFSPVALLMPAGSTMTASLLKMTWSSSSGLESYRRQLSRAVSRWQQSPDQQGGSTFALCKAARTLPRELSRPFRTCRPVGRLGLRFQSPPIQKDPGAKKTEGPRALPVTRISFRPEARAVRVRTVSLATTTLTPMFHRSHMRVPDISLPDRLAQEFRCEHGACCKVSLQ